MNLIPIDPGEITGWAVFEERRLVMANATKRAELFSDKTGRVAPPQVVGQTDVLIEIPRVYPHEREVDPNDLIGLAVLVGELKGFYERQGCRVKLVPPREWKGTVPKEVHNRRVLRALSAEEIALLPKRPRAKDYDNNMVDAVGMGLWELGRMLP